MTIVTQYDVELFQKIEQLTGQQMEVFPTQQEAVLLLLERVNDAQRIATMQVGLQSCSCRQFCTITMKLECLLVVFAKSSTPSARQPHTVHVDTG